MGNRAVVIFTDGEDYSPVVYLHWNGYDVPTLLLAWKERMQGRECDLQYGCARFIGICHDHIPGNLSLGVWQWDTKSDVEDNCPGDAGIFLVNVLTNTVQRKGTSISENECPAPMEFQVGQTFYPKKEGEI